MTINGLHEMDFEEYQLAAQQSAVYPGRGGFVGLAYVALGVAGEAGEVAEQVKKTWRNEDGEVTPEREAAIAEELGDVLWYVSQVCTELKLNMQDVAEANLEKLRRRREAGELKVHE